MKKIFILNILMLALIGFVSAQSNTYMPTIGHKDTVCSSVVLYDDGGKNANHSVSCNGTYTFATSNSGNVFRINIYQDIRGYDTDIASLRIFEGGVNSTDLLYQCKTSGAVSYLIYSTSDTITVKFKSDDDNPLSGFVISLEEVCNQYSYVSCSFTDSVTAELSWTEMSDVDYYVVEYVDTTDQWYNCMTENHVVCDSSKYNIQKKQSSTSSITLTNLGQCRCLYYNVYGVKTSGTTTQKCRGYIHYGSNYCPTPPSQCYAIVPQNVQYTYVTYDSVVVTWDSVKGVKWYADNPYEPLDSNFYSINLNCDSRSVYLVGDTTGTVDWCNYYSDYIVPKSCRTIRATDAEYTYSEDGPFNYEGYDGHISYGYVDIRNDEGKEIYESNTVYIGVKEVTKNSITITWLMPSDDTITTDVVISWKKTDDYTAETFYDTISKDSTTYTITKLDSNTMYTVGVELKCDYCQRNVTRNISTVLGSCLDYTDFYSPKTFLTWGDYQDPYTSFMNKVYSKAYYYRMDDTNNVWFAISEDNRHKVIRDTNAYDLRTDGQLRKVPHGEVASVQLGNEDKGRQAESIAYEYTVDTNEYDMVVLKYAVVMQDPAHTKENQPRFKLDILDEDGNLIDSTCGSADFYAAGDLGWNEVAGSVPKTIWKDWTTIGVGLSQYHGQTIRIRFTTYDCDEGGHFGYAYFTLRCEKAHIYLVNRCDAEDSIHLTAPEGFEYAWTREGDTTVLSTLADFIAPVDTNVYHCKASFIGKPECYFTITTHSIDILPVAKASYKIDTCASAVTFYNESYMEFDTTYYAFTKQMIDSVLWIFDDTLYVSADSVVMHYPKNGLYDIKLISMLSNSDCVDTLKIKLNIGFNQNVRIDGWDNVCLGDTLELSVGGVNSSNVSFLWNTGQTGRTIKVVPTAQDTLYSVDVTVNNNCGGKAFKSIKINDHYYDTTDVWICDGQVCDTLGFREKVEGQYKIHYQAMTGCDSIKVLNLFVYPKYNITLSDTICSSVRYTLNDFDENQSGSYVKHLQTVNGCDSTVTLNLTVNPSADTIVYASICRGETYTDNNFEEHNSGIYVQNLKTDFGCDSIVTLKLSVDSVFNTIINADICDNQSYDSDGFSQTEQGVYTQHLTSKAGCDSIVTLNLYVHPTYNDTIKVVVGCGTGYTDLGFNVTESGFYVQHLQSYYGCDSISNLDFTYIEPFVDTITEEIYSEQKYVFDGQEFSETGIYNITYTDMFGCDSVYVIDLTVTKLSFPKVITPNGDGINDVFTIKGLLESGIFDDVLLKVYNRYGRQIYSNDKFNTESDFWDPEATNTADGTYFYRFIAKGKKKSIDFSGSVEVLREH